MKMNASGDLPSSVIPFVAKPYHRPDSNCLDHCPVIKGYYYQRLLSIHHLYAVKTAKYYLLSLKAARNYYDVMSRCKVSHL